MESESRELQSPSAPSYATQVSFLISTLAMYQTIFWASVADELARRGHKVAFLTFDDRSHEYLQQHSLESFSISARGRGKAQDSSDEAFAEWLLHYNMDNANLWLSHERITFGIRQNELLRKKLVSYAFAVESAVHEFEKTESRIVMLQELGGFISVIASFFVARKHGIDNYFIEPSFFRGRMFMLKNVFDAPRISPGQRLVPSREVSSYLDATIASRSIVVPLKDRHQYRSAFRKVINWRNSKRLSEKLIDKYLLGKQQEFGHIRIYVGTHLRMLWNSTRLRRYYTPLETLGKFVYYPLHVPADVALTLRSPEYLDQLSVVDYLCRVVPHNYRVVIKEHPAMVGGMDGPRLLYLLRQNDNLVLLSPDTNNYDVLSASDAVVSVNSKSGAEAMLLGKPVVVLGNAFYRDAPLATPIDRLSDLPEALRRILHHHKRDDTLGVRIYFQRVWEQTVPGELYVNQHDNITAFSESIVAATG